MNNNIKTHRNKMEIRFDGKRALVTGGGRGIGREIAQSLVRCGAKVYVFTKSASSVESLQQNDPEIEVLQVDVANWDNTRKAVDSILPIDQLVNNAGIMCDKSFINFTESDIDDNFNVNYKAAFNISQSVASDLIKRNKPGSIVNVSSVSSMKCLPGDSMYGSIKAALDSLTKYMALELGSKQIRVNAINPTVIPTDMTKDHVEDPVHSNKILSAIPIGRFGEIREAADVVLFLLSDRASLVNGVTMPVDGGHVL